MAKRTFRTNSQRSRTKTRNEMRSDCNGVQNLRDYRCPTNRIAATAGFLSTRSVPGFAPIAAAQHLGVAGGIHRLDHLEDALGPRRAAPQMKS
jgi:hypothetical protein